MVPRSTYRLNPVEGSLTLLTINQGDPTMNPAFSRVNRKSNVLYACTESVEENGHIVSWRVDTDSGRLTRIGCADAQGTSTCYITLDRTQRNALVVNYWNATIVNCAFTSGEDTALTLFAAQVVLAINPETGAIEGPRSVYDPNEGREMSVKADAHVNHSVNDESAQKERQLDPHSHAVILDPYMGKIAYVPDLGMDVIRQLTFDEVSGTLKSAGTVKSGSPGRVALGPRCTFTVIRRPPCGTVLMFRPTQILSFTRHFQWPTSSMSFRPKLLCSSLTSTQRGG